jgi:dephospho-CoA kinase
MTVIGVTGGTGAGKTSALRALERMGAHVIDCDEVYHGLLADCGEMAREIAERFPDAASPDGIDRRALGRVVFGDPGELEALNEITHGYVRAEVGGRLERCAEGGCTLAAVDAVALVESGIHELCDIVVGIVAPARLREARVTARDGIDAASARARIDAQRTEAFFRENCDRILVNDYADAAVFEKVCGAFFGDIITKYNSGGGKRD